MNNSDDNGHDKTSICQWQWFFSMTILFTPSINSTNINITNYYLLFQTIEHKEKETMIYAFGNPGPGLRQAHTCGRAKPVCGIPTLLSW